MQKDGCNQLPPPTENETDDLLEARNIEVLFLVRLANFVQIKQNYAAEAVLSVMHRLKNLSCWKVLERNLFLWS